MAHDLPVPSTKAAHTWGRRAAPQGDRGGWPSGTQWGTNKAKIERREEGKEPEGDKSEDNNEEQGNSKEEDEKDSRYHPPRNRICQ